MNKRCAGFTLVEVMMVAAILSIVVIAVPSMLQWLGRQGVGHAVDQLQADLQLARLTAINRQRSCSIEFGQPADNRYRNSLTGSQSDLQAYRGGVHFLGQAPDGKKMAEKITFNQRGLSTSVAPVDIFLTDRDRRSIYRLRVLLPGGVSRCQWKNERWQ